MCSVDNCIIVSTNNFILIDGCLQMTLNNVSVISLDILLHYTRHLFTQVTYNTLQGGEERKFYKINRDGHADKD